MMDSIEAIIVRHQSAWETSSSNEMRKTVVISLGAANSLTNNNEVYIFMLHWESKLLLPNDRIVNAMIMFYVMLQEITAPATTFDCNEHARLRKQQPTFSTLTNARRKAPARRLIARPRCKRLQCNIHFSLSYCAEQRQQQANAREDQTDSHATIKIACCCLQDATMTVPCNATIHGANTPRLSTVSMPKKACKHAKDDVYNANGMYVAKGK